MPEPKPRERPVPSIAHPPPAALEALGEAVGALLDDMMRVAETGPEFSTDLEAALSKVREAHALVLPHGKSRDQVRMGGQHEGPDDARPYYIGSPLVGPHNPALPFFEFEHADGRSSGEVRFPLRFEGPPVSLHGGVVALFFDQILGHHHIVMQVPAMTGTLTVRYRRPTPLFRPLRFEVTTDEPDGRKLLTHAALWDGDVLVAEAEGLFVRPRWSLTGVVDDEAIRDPSSS